MIPEAEKMIEAYSEWLNSWPAEEGIEKQVVTREMYDEWDDAPQLVVDSGDVMSGHLYGLRVITLNVSPFHDEGGHSHLVGIFHQYRAEDEWELNSMVAEFDTMLSVVVQEGQVGQWKLAGPHDPKAEVR